MNRSAKRIFALFLILERMHLFLHHLHVTLSMGFRFYQFDEVSVYSKFGRNELFVFFFKS